MNSSFDQRKAGFLLGAIIVIGIGVYFAGQAADKKDQEGKTALYQVEKTYDDEIKNVPEAERAGGVAMDVDAKLPKTVAQLNELLAAKKAPKRVLFEASMRLGTLYLDHGQADKASAAFKQLGETAGSAFQKASSAYLLGVSEERANHFKEALASYQNGLTANVDGLKGELYLGIVRMDLKLNDKENAKLNLEKMNKDVPGSHSAEIAAELVKGTQS